MLSNLPEILVSLAFVALLALKLDPFDLLMPNNVQMTILALLVVLHPRILSALLNMALRLLKRNSVVLTLRYSDILLVTLAWCVSWVVAGLAFYVLLLALWTHTPLSALPICIGIYAIVYKIFRWE